MFSSCTIGHKEGSHKNDLKEKGANSVDLTKIYKDATGTINVDAKTIRRNLNSRAYTK